jgi:hypothetical protein
MSNNIQPMNPARMTHLPPGDFSMLVLRDAAASLDQARGYIERCSDAHPNDPIVLARALTIQILAETLDQYILSTGDNPMPTEQPKLPYDSHARQLAGRGANQDMGLTAFEVAEIRRPSTARRNAERVLIGAVIGGACVLAGVVGALLIWSVA